MNDAPANMKLRPDVAVLSLIPNAMPNDERPVNRNIADRRVCCAVSSLVFVGLSAPVPSSVDCRTKPSLTWLISTSVSLDTTTEVMSATNKVSR